MVKTQSTRLTRLQVLTIRRHWSAGETITRLAEVFDRTPETISSIVHFRTYRRVKDDPDLPPLPSSAQGAPQGVKPRARPSISS